MSEIPMEKKLELVRQVRKQYQKNQQDLVMRENILTGREQNEKPSSDMGNEEGIILDGSIKLRFIIAVILLITVIYIDQSGRTISGVSSDLVFQLIANDWLIP